MKVAIICSNLFNTGEKSKKGTDIFNYILANSLAIAKKDKDVFTFFASGESSLPFRIESIDHLPSSSDPKIISNGKHIMFELALISKAFSMQDDFDLYHLNIGDGDLAMPFACFVKKPLIVTLHNIIDEDHTRKYFSMFKDLDNVFFVSASDYQRKLLPMLKYAGTVHHGIDTAQFDFSPDGGEHIMWAGRLIPGKGPDIVIRLAEKLKRRARLFGIIKSGYEGWFNENVKERSGAEAGGGLISLYLDRERSDLIRYYKESRLFLLPTCLEEAFGFVYAESMSCGTPVVTYARGAAPEVVADGLTGFLVNPSENDIRGDWIIKKTGFDGLCEAVEKIFSMGRKEYMAMRKECRRRAVENFSDATMAGKYLEIYKKFAKKKHEDIY